MWSEYLNKITQSSGIAIILSRCMPTLLSNFMHKNPVLKYNTKQENSTVLSFVPLNLIIQRCLLIIPGITL